MRKVIILSAGKGTRMKSKLPKVMHKLCNLPMMQYVCENSKVDDETEIIAVVGHESEKIVEYFGESIKYAYQLEQLGTAHAVMMAIDHINDDDEVIITCGDTPLISKETFVNLINRKKEGYGAVVTTSFVDNPFGYGRIVKENNLFKKIVEEKDSDDVQKQIKEVNVGTYIIDGYLLKNCISKISNNNKQNEYYLTDVFEFASKESKVATLPIDNTEMLGINSKLQLSEAERILRQKINNFHLENGVTIIDPASTYIDKDVVIGRDCTIYPNVHIQRNSTIDDESIIRENTTIENSKIGKNCVIKSSTIVDSKVGDNTTVGPYAYLRPNSDIGDNCKIGDFVEVKNAKLHDGVKASHLAYIGDAEVFENVNIGCGVVFANYDGKNKHKTIVGKGAFIGSNANLVAPVTVGENVLVAAGSTITNDVPDSSLAIARQRQINKTKK